MFSNRYIFIYSTVMVIVVAAVLSFAAMILKPMQQKNIAIAKIQGILASADIRAEKENAQTIFSDYISKELLIDESGKVVSIFQDGELVKGDTRAFEIDLKKELYKKSQGESYKSPLYIANINGDTVYIVPLLGKGLWGPIYGNIALKSDFNEVFNADFGHDKETPGLGAEINTREFANQFIGKKIFDEEGNFQSIDVVKGGASTLPAAQEIHGVDAISGGTITSNGVTEMLENCLENYVPYIKKNI